MAVRKPKRLSVAGGYGAHTGHYGPRTAAHPTGPAAHPTGPFVGPGNPGRLSFNPPPFNPQQYIADQNALGAVFRNAFNRFGHGIGPANFNASGGFNSDAFLGLTAASFGSDFNGGGGGGLGSGGGGLGSGDSGSGSLGDFGSQGGGGGGSGSGPTNLQLR